MNYLLIIDIETNGLIIKNDYDDHLSQYPEIIEIAWQLYDYNRELIKEKTYLIKSSGTNVLIPENIEKLTGITAELIEKDGFRKRDIIAEFINVIERFRPTIISHNCDFDLSVIIKYIHEFKKEFNFSDYPQICTMKSSVNYCDLPNLKYPKLGELYEKLFNIKLTTLHRALIDVKITSEVFFKMLDLNIVQLSIKNKPEIDLNDISHETIKESISNYISDLNKYPLFYDYISTTYHNDSYFVKNGLNKITTIKNKYNIFYQTEIGFNFEIPYNQVANREMISLNFDDIIIRYNLVNYLKLKTNFIPSTEKYDDEDLIFHCNSELEKGNIISVKIDIFNCYESINHNLLLEEIKNDLEIDERSIYYNVLANSLKVIFKNNKDQIFKKDKGLIIGSKPDEYLAEYFLDKIETRIKRENIKILRITDEFIFFNNDFSKTRKSFCQIEEIIEQYGLKLNKSKTIIKDYRLNSSSNALKIEKDFVSVNSSFNEMGGYNFSIIQKSDLNKKSKDVNQSKSILKENEEEIVTYDSSIFFLKNMLKSQREIKHYQEKYPNYRYLNNIVHSQPTDFRNDFYQLDYSMFTYDNVRKLKDIIFRYPKGANYNALALQLLVYIATNTKFVIFYPGDEEYSKSMNEIEYSLHKTCEFSNLSIIEILKSEDIHEYQKYILLRCLFKKPDSLKLDLEQYKVQFVNYDNDNYIDKLPFYDEILKEVIQIESKTTHYGLKTICTELKNLFWAQLLI